MYPYNHLMYNLQPFKPLLYDPNDFYDSLGTLGPRTTGTYT
jgi:hypothetical protein